MKNINLEQINTLTKSLMPALSTPRSSPQIEREQKLLAEISQIADFETANKAKDLLHSEKHTYPFDGYLYWLSELSHLLLCGMPKDDALKFICVCVDNPKSIDDLYQALADFGTF